MKSHCKNGHPYTTDNIDFRKDNTYACRTCRQDRQNYYNAVNRGELRDPPGKMPATERIADLLQIDGGWLTNAGIAVRLDIDESTVAKSLHRLRTRGRVKSRLVDLGNESRAEWRFSTFPMSGSLPTVAFR